MLFFIIIIITSIVSPILYNKYAIKVIEEISSTELPNDKKPGSLKLLDIILSSIFISLSLVISIYGMKSKNIIQTSIGIIFFIFILISISIITYLKISNPEVYRLQKFTADTDISYNLAFISVLSMFLMNNWREVSILILFVLGGYIFSVLFLYYMNSLDKKKKKNLSLRNDLLSIGIPYGVVFIIYLAFINRIKT